MKIDEISKTRESVNRSKIDVNEREDIIKERKMAITKYRDLLSGENQLILRAFALADKENYMTELEYKNQQLTESLKSENKELESAKELLAKMMKKIEILEGEKSDLELRVSTLESYINNGTIDYEQRKILEDIRTMMEGTYYIYF